MTLISRIIFIICLTACAADVGVHQRPIERFQSPPRVVLVVVNDLPSDLTPWLPAWRKLAAEGAWTLKAQTEALPATVVSHAAMFTGFDATKNGVKALEPGPDRDLDTWRPLTQKTVFETWHSWAGTGLLTGAVIRQQKLRGLLPETAIDALTFAKSDMESVSAACSLMIEHRDGPQLLYVQLAGLEAVGEDRGAQTMRISQDLATIRECFLSARDLHKGAYYLIVTSDRASQESGPANATSSAEDRVPWVVTGFGIAKGRELAGPVRLVDTGAVILRLLFGQYGIDLTGLDGQVPAGVFLP